MTAERIKALEDALRNIRELNETGADENGHRWANSDLIEQEIVFALAASQPVQPVAWQRLVDGKWQNCSEFVALGFTGDAQKHDPDVRPVYATPQPITVQDAQPVAVTGELFIDEDGDVCINDGRENNLVFCPASDDDGKPLCPDVMAEIVGRFNAAIQPLTVQDAARVPEIENLIEVASCAAKVLEIAVSDIAELENTLSQYKEDWRGPQSARDALTAALRAIAEGE